jgi:hypothetical protein
VQKAYPETMVANCSLLVTPKADQPTLGDIHQEQSIEEQYHSLYADRDLT